MIPLRRILPGYGGIDLASLLVALILQMLMIALLIALQTGTMLPLLPLMMASLIGLAAYLVKIYFFAILAMIILSWVAQGGNNPALRLLFQLTEPVMAPFRKLLPPMGGLDLSPIFVFILINIIQIALGHLASSLGVAGLVPWL